MSGPTGPAVPFEGQVWYNEDNGRAYVYYDDGSSSQWVEFGNANVGPTGPTGYTGAASTVTGPTGYTGSAGDPTLTINAQTGTTYTLVLTDASKLVTFGNAASIALTVPLNSSVAFTTGTQINISQILAGRVTVAGAVGVTVNSALGLKTRTQWSVATLIKTDTNTWILTGDTSVL
jgi:hypothetical protein